MHKTRLSLVWVMMMMLGVFAPVSHAQTACSIRSVVGASESAKGHVAFTDGTPLNLRDAPSRSATVIERLPEGTNFTLLDSTPTCADGIHWYHIAVGALDGWVAEAVDDAGYFILSGHLDLGGVAPSDVQVVYFDAYSSDAAGLGGQLVVEDGNCGSLPPLELTYSEYNEAYIELVAGVVGFYTGYDSTPVDMGTNVPITVGRPVCSFGARYYPTFYNSFEFVPESVDGQYVVQPFMLNPTPAALSVPMEQPQITTFNHPLPTVTPDESLYVPDDWVWEPIYDRDVPDPSQLVLPERYQGGMPNLPVDLSQVLFVEQAGLSNDGLVKLATNGFVVVPGGYSYFDQAYYPSAAWNPAEGNPTFVTTDTMLNALYLVYENTQRYLETEALYGVINQVVAASLADALLTYEASIGTALYPEARAATLYYLVAAMLLDEGLDEYMGFFPSETRRTTQVLATVPDDLQEEAFAVVTMIKSAQGQARLSFLDDYEEDFSQYKPRSYYAGNPLLESYFRGMMWLGRITFRAKSDYETRTGVLVLRALKNGGMLAELDKMDAVLRYLVGSADDLTYTDLLPLATAVYGEDMALTFILDNEGRGTLAAYRDGLNALPGPRINSLILPVGVRAEQVDELTRGFRVFGQRFTFDAYALQNLVFPAVGTQELFRPLPTAEDVAAVLGSDIAYAQVANDAQYLHFVENMTRLREEVNVISSAGWHETFYGAWLHAIQPLLVRNPVLLPPAMQTDAWKARDLNTALGSYAELKHATLLYAEQAYGGRGGGGGQPPLTAYGVVEPNPLVFARVAILADLLPAKLKEYGYYDNPMMYGNLNVVMNASKQLAQLSANLADMARREIAGESLTEDQLYLLQEYFGGVLGSIRNTVQDLQTEPPNCAALVADIASNPSTNQILYVGTGSIDLIYVITGGPYGLQLTRGAVYSSYSVIGDAQSRLTDDDWRVRFGTESQPFRPAWSEQYLDTIAADNRFACAPRR